MVDFSIQLSLRLWIVFSAILGNRLHGASFFGAVAGDTAGSSSWTVVMAAGSHQQKNQRKGEQTESAEG